MPFFYYNGNKNKIHKVAILVWGYFEKFFPRLTCILLIIKNSFIENFKGLWAKIAYR